MSKKGISLFELNATIKNVLKTNMDSAVWVVAEISDLRHNQTGHCYLELIEKDETSDQIIAKARATIWSYTYRMLKPYFESSTGQRFTSGIKVMLKVSVEFQEIYGFSLNIKDIDPSYTLGDMARKRKEIIARLEQEGVADMNQLLEFPEVPKCIAVISSPTAAGYEDFANQLENNSEGYRFYHHLFPAIMQGSNAETSIVAALDKIANYDTLFDVVVIIRGGGATSDLNCFDSYWLAYNIAQFPLPVISGIGHERDETIVDMVAHTRVKTPTAAAEFLIDCFDARADYHNDLQTTFLNGVNDILQDARENLQYQTKRFSPLVKQIISNKKERLLLANEQLIFATRKLARAKRYELKHQQNRLKYLTETKLTWQTKKIQNIEKKIGIRVQHLLDNQKHKLSLFEQSAKYLNPENILKKGYTLTLKDGIIIKDKNQLKANDTIITKFKDGEVKSIVKA